MPVKNQPGCGPCCAKSAVCVPAPPCVHALLAICNTNSKIDDDWNVNLNNHDLGDLDFSANECRGQIWATDVTAPVSLSGLCCAMVDGEFVSPLALLKSRFVAGTNTLTLTRLTDRGLANLGGITVTTLRKNEFGQWSICKTPLNTQYRTPFVNPDETLTFTFEMDAGFFGEQPGCGDPPVVVEQPCEQFSIKVCGENFVDLALVPQLVPLSIGVNGTAIGVTAAGLNGGAGHTKGFWITDISIDSTLWNDSCPNAGAAPATQLLPAGLMMASGINVITLTNTTGTTVTYGPGVVEVTGYVNTASGWQACNRKEYPIASGSVLPGGGTATITSQQDPCICESSEAATYSGHGCLKCIPRYKCATVVFTPAEYSDLCPSVHKSKMWYYCGTNPSWGNYEPVDSGRVGIGLELYRIDTGAGCKCLYKVSLAVGGENEIFESIEPEDLGDMIFSITDERGTFDVTIAPAAVVPNPLALAACAPCICTTCLPLNLKVTVTGKNECGEDVSRCTVVAFDCVAYADAEFTGLEQGDVTVSIAPTPLSENRCSLDISISGLSAEYANPDPGTLEGGIPLEGGPRRPEGSACLPVTLFDCRELPRLDHPQDYYFQGTKGRGDCPGWMEAGMIDTTQVVLDNTTREPILSVRVQDASCATCPQTSIICPGACKALDELQLVDGHCCNVSLRATLITDCPTLGDLSVSLYRNQCESLPIYLFDGEDSADRWDSGDPDGNPVLGCQGLYMSYQIVPGESLGYLGGYTPPFPPTVGVGKTFFWQDPEHTGWIADEVAAGRILPEAAPFAGWDVSLRWGYVRPPCDTDVLDPYKYMLLFTYHEFYGESQGIYRKQLRLFPTFASCSPFVMEYELGMSWDSLFAHPYGPSFYPWMQPPLNSCVGISTPMKIRITL